MKSQVKRYDEVMEPYSPGAPRAAGPGLVLSERHLALTVREYLAHDNGEYHQAA